MKTKRVTKRNPKAAMPKKHEEGWRVAGVQIGRAISGRGDLRDPIEEGLARRKAAQAAPKVA